MSNVEVPDLTGPSTFATSLTVTATPDNITADGSESRVVATVRDANGAPIANVPLRIAIVTGNVEVDYGTVTARTIYTGANGTATVVYVSPVLSPFFAGGPGRVLEITATPIGSNYETAVSQHASIKVTPPPVPASTLGAPIAAVTSAPLAPKVGQLVNFDASASVAGSGRSIISYFWDFGDGLPNEEHGSDASHAYAAPGRYTMVLGVVDDLGRISSVFNSITVTP